MLLKLNNALVHLNGTKLLGICEETTTPEVKNKMITQKPLGHVSEIELPGGLEKMETKFKLTAPDKDALMMLANPTKAVRVQTRGSLEKWDGEGINDEQAVVIMARGFGKVIPGGAYKQNENAAVEVQMTVNSYKLTVAGTIIFDIDTIANKYIAAGDDVIAKLKGNIGF
jgi:hypothetical protein